MILLSIATVRFVGMTDAKICSLSVSTISPVEAEAEATPIWEAPTAAAPAREVAPALVEAVVQQAELSNWRGLSPRRQHRWPRRQ